MPQKGKKVKNCKGLPCPTEIPPTPPVKEPKKLVCRTMRIELKCKCCCEVAFDGDFADVRELSMAWQEEHEPCWANLPFEPITKQEETS